MSAIRDREKEDGLIEEPDEGFSDSGLSFEERKALATRKFQEKWSIDQGVNPYASIIGETLSPKTVKSYEDLNKEFEEHPYYAPRRAFERLKKNLASTKRAPTVEITINSILRLKDEKTGREYLTYTWTESLEDINGNEHHQEYNYGGVYEILEGDTKRDIDGQILKTEVTGKRLEYEIPFLKKAVDDILKKNTITTNTKPYLAVAYCRTKGGLFGRSVALGRIYQILNLDDFKNGSWEDLKALGERGLSEEKPSLSKLKSPIMSDPANSLWRQKLPIQPVMAVQQQSQED